MKKALLFLSFLAFCTAVSFGQSFSDDFESYMDGDLIALTNPTNWGTWSGVGGGADDSAVSSEEAYSGDLSLKLEASGAAGGPADIVLPFGGTYDVGTFSLETYMYVKGGNGGYFNLQAVEPVGTIWAVECYFNPGGALVVSNQAQGQILTGEFSYDVWMKINWDIDLTNNSWKLSIDDNEVGTFENANNSVASMNIFAYGGGTAVGYYFIDDISYEYEEPNVPTWDASMKTVDVRPQGLTGQEVTIRGIVRNTGMNNINSFDVTWSDGTNEYTESFSGYDLATFEEGEFEHSTTYTLMEGNNSVEVTVSNPNGEMDMFADNDTKVAEITGYTPAPGKRVVVEEATGTWCPWCPRGTVFMDRMTDAYPDHFIGIAVHNADPMEVEEYDAGLTSFPGFTGFPSVILDRTQVLDPSDIEQFLLPRLQEAPSAFISTDGDYDPGTGDMTINVHADFQTAVSGDWRLNVVIVEDGVTGTGSGYDQYNYYAGGNFGEMGGYENLPNPVPAAQMVYDHVGRAILAGWAGQTSSLPSSIASGETHSYTFSYNLPSTYDPNAVHVVAMLIAPNGEIDNSSSETIAELVTSNTTEVFRNDLAQVSPNPFSDFTEVRLNLEQAANVQMTVFNSIGEMVAHRDYGQLNGEMVLPFAAGNLESGMYFFHIQVDDTLITKKVQLVR